MIEKRYRGRIVSEPSLRNIELVTKEMAQELRAELLLQRTSNGIPALLWQPKIHL